MRRTLALAAALMLTAATPALAGPTSSSGYAPVRMTPKTGFLTAEERKVVNLLIRAANQMTAIYNLQAAGKDAGHGFYPPGLTKAELDAYIAAHPAEKAGLMDFYTVVRRDGAKLTAVPYSVAYRPQLAQAAALLEQAAAVTSNKSLKTFLKLRAKAFRDNDYFASEMAWMDLTGTPIEVVIGPYETYTDELYGQKAAFEAFVTLKDPKESAALDRYKAHLKDMEANLPVPDSYKNFKRGGASPLVVAEEIHGGGDNLSGPPTIAFNLPNDEKVREAKGAKKVVLSNVLDAKYERMLKPIGARVLTPAQAALVAKKYMTWETLFHELSHSLGPGSITVGGRATTVSAELKEIGGTAEEAKADVMGVWNILYMMKIGEIPAAERPQLFATYFAGIFRAARWGDEEAHGRGAALQYGYLKSKGAFAYDPRTGVYTVNDDKMAAGIRDLVGEIVRIQGDGDYPAMVALFDRYAHLDADAKAVIAKLKDIPVDIAPIYPEKI